VAISSWGFETETSERKYHYSLPNNPDDGTSHVFYNGCLKSRKLIITQSVDHVYDYCSPQIRQKILTRILPLLESESTSDTCMTTSWLVSGRLCSPRGGFGLRRLTVSSWMISLPPDWPDTNPAATQVNADTDQTL